jgi:HlyD family secretion protein
VISAVAALLAAAAGGGVWWMKRGATQRKQSPAPVQALRPDELSFTGKIQAENTLSLPAPIEGSIEEFLVDAGEEVYEGQLLARLKNTILESARDSAAGELERAQTRVQRTEAGVVQARLEASRARAEASRARGESDRLEKLYLRQQLLHKEGATPRLTFEKAQKEYETAHAESANLEELATQTDERVTTLNKDLDTARRLLEEKTLELDLAKADLAATEVHSPVDGLVIARRGEVGQEISREMKDMFQIATDLSLLIVTFDAGPQLAVFLRPGQPAAVQVVEAGSETMPGEVKDVNDTNVVVEFRSPNPAVKPGLNAQVRIKIV